MSSHSQPDQSLLDMDWGGMLFPDGTPQHGANGTASAPEPAPAPEPEPVAEPPSPKPVETGDLVIDQDTIAEAEARHEDAAEVDEVDPLDALTITEAVEREAEAFDAAMVAAALASPTVSSERTAFDPLTVVTQIHAGDEEPPEAPDVNFMPSLAEPDDTNPLDAFDATFSELPESVDASSAPAAISTLSELPEGLVRATVPPPLPTKRQARELPPELPPPLPHVEPVSAPASEAPPQNLRFRERPAVKLGPKSKGIIGIDLGTTYSCAAIVQDGKPRVLPSRTGGPTIPSVVRYLPGGKSVVGPSATRNAESYAERTILGSKRLMGRAFTSPVVQEVKNHFAYDVVAGREGEAAIRVDDEIIALEDVAASILEEIRESVALQVKTAINRAVITCPAHFSERQREAVRRAGELAGYHVERVLNEPTAAALNYAVGQGMQRRRMLVYDLGGGTFDVSVLEVEGDVFEVLATGGDTFLGGLDFDACIVEMLAEAFVEQEHIDPREDPAAIAKLFEFAERAKRDLSYRSSTIVQIDHLVVRPYAARSLTVGLRRARVEQAFEPLVAQTLSIVKDVVSRAKLELGDIDDVILVGGQSRAPIIGRCVQQLFSGKAPLDRVDPEEAVALGAARYAASLDADDTIVLIDALPLSIGVGLPGGRFKKLLMRDTRLPTKQTYHVRTTKDDQQSYEVAIFQGESERAAENEPLGILVLENLPNGPRGTVVVEVTLEVSAECVLSVHASEHTTGHEVSTQMVTKHTPEELRMKLGLPPQPTHEELERRRAAVFDRPKSVWKWITGLFSRRR